MVNRASGTSDRLGSSHASRLTSTTTLGGKAGWTPASRRFLEAGQTVLKEALSPLADDLTREVETRGDDIVSEAGRSQENDFRADDVSIRRRIFARHRFQRCAFVVTERDEKRAPSRHQMASVARSTVP
jgi:hypothetical protein